jgi:hypothetical protein
LSSRDEAPAGKELVNCVVSCEEVRLVTKKLEELLAAAKHVELTPEQREEQRRSFAFGNTNIEDPRITREMVNEEAEKLKQSEK